MEKEGGWVAPYGCDRSHVEEIYMVDLIVVFHSVVRLTSTRQGPNSARSGQGPSFDGHRNRSFGESIPHQSTLEPVSVRSDDGCGTSEH
jgi:hypothetical protein